MAPTTCPGQEPALGDSSFKPRTQRASVQPMPQAGGNWVEGFCVNTANKGLPGRGLPVFWRLSRELSGPASSLSPAPVPSSLGLSLGGATDKQGSLIPDPCSSPSPSTLGFPAERSSVCVCVCVCIGGFRGQDTKQDLDLGGQQRRHELGAGKSRPAPWALPHRLGQSRAGSYFQPQLCFEGGDPVLLGPWSRHDTALQTVWLETTESYAVTPLEPKAPHQASRCQKGTTPLLSLQGRGLLAPSSVWWPPVSLACGSIAPVSASVVTRSSPCVCVRTSLFLGQSYWKRGLTQPHFTMTSAKSLLPTQAASQVPQAVTSTGLFGTQVQS